MSRKYNSDLVLLFNALKKALSYGWNFTICTGNNEITVNFHAFYYNHGFNDFVNDLQSLPNYKWSNFQSTCFIFDLCI